MRRLRVYPFQLARETQTNPPYDRCVIIWRIHCLMDTRQYAGPENSEASVRLRSYGCLFFCVAFNHAGCAGGVVLRSRRDAASGPFGLLLPRRKARAAGGAIRPPAGAYGSAPLRFSGGGCDGAPTRAQRMHALTNFIGTSMRSATCSGVIPLFRNRLQTAFIFSPTSTICLSGS